MEHINETLKKIKVIHKNFVCPQCKEDGAYSYWDNDQRCHKWRCPYCGKEDFLSNLNSKVCHKQK